MYVVGYYLFSISKRYKTSQKKCIFRIAGRANIYFSSDKLLGPKMQKLAKSQHTQRKPLYFENSTSGSSSKIGHKF